MLFCLNTLSKYKIFDNLRRSLFEIATIVLLVWGICTKSQWIVLTSLGIVIYPFVLEILTLAFSRKEGEKKQRTFTPHIAGVKGAIYRAILTVGCVPYKAYVELKATPLSFRRKYRFYFRRRRGGEFLSCPPPHRAKAAHPFR